MGKSNGQVREEASALQDKWTRTISSQAVPERKQFIIWAQMFGLEPCLKAMEILRRRIEQWKNNGEEVLLVRATFYLSGTARNIKQQADILESDNAQD